MLKDDIVTAKVREARILISKRFGHDVKKVIEYYIERQKKHQSRLGISKRRKGKSVANHPSL